MKWKEEIDYKYVDVSYWDMCKHAFKGYDLPKLISTLKHYNHVLASKQMGELKTDGDGDIIYQIKIAYDGCFVRKTYDSKSVRESDYGVQAEVGMVGVSTGAARRYELNTLQKGYIYADSVYVLNARMFYLKTPTIVKTIESSGFKGYKEGL